MVGISPTEMRLASSFAEEAIRSLATSHGTLPGAAWPGCERWRSGDETKMPLPVAKKRGKNYFGYKNHVGSSPDQARFIRTNDLYSLAFFDFYPQNATGRGLFLRVHAPQTFS